MNFTPEDGLCCPSVEKLLSTSEYDPRILKFMAWVKSLPVKSERHSKPAAARNVSPLKDQPFVVKIIEDGWALLFHGAFAPREGQGDSGGFVRIPYFDLITSDFKEMHSEGNECEVVVCQRHEKRFLLVLCLRAPIDEEPYSKELVEAWSEVKHLEEPCGVMEDDGLLVPYPDPSATRGEGEEDAAVLSSLTSNPKCCGINRPKERSSSLQLVKGLFGGGFF